MRQLSYETSRSVILKEAYIITGEADPSLRA